MRTLAPILLLMVAVLSLTRIATASRLLAYRHERESTATALLMRHGRTIAALLEEVDATSRAQRNNGAETGWIMIVRREAQARQDWSFEEGESGEGWILVRLPVDGLPVDGLPEDGVPRIGEILVYQGTIRGVYLRDE